MKMNNKIIITLVFLATVAFLGCIGTSIKEINQNP